MNIISQLLSISNKIDKKSPKLADRLEKTAAMINNYVPQNILEKGHSNFGGKSIPSGNNLGGYHLRYKWSKQPSFDPTAVQEASSFIEEVDSLPSFEQWQQQHPNLKSDPVQVFSVLKTWQPFLLSGITDISQLQSILNISGPVDLQFASQNLGGNFKDFGITPAEVMTHEIAHATGKKSTKEEYLQRINQGADILNSPGMGGNINPRYKPYQFMQSFNADDHEYGPNLHIMERLLKENR